MGTTVETRKSQRGTKRVCRSCEEKFYDLGRDPTVCPMCKASLPLAEFVRRAEPTRPGYSGGWSRKPLVHAILPAEEEAVALPDDAQADEVAIEAPVAEGDAILEQEEELENDVSDLLSPDGEATPDE